MADEQSGKPWVVIGGGALAVGGSAGIASYLQNRWTLSAVEIIVVSVAFAALAFVVEVLFLESKRRDFRGPAVVVLLLGIVAVVGIVLHADARQRSDVDQVAAPATTSANSTPTIQDSPPDSAEESPDPSLDLATDAVQKDPDPPPPDRQVSDSGGSQAATLVQPCWSVPESLFQRPSTELLDHWGGPIAQVGDPLKYSVTMNVTVHTPAGSGYRVNIEALQPSCSWKVVATLRAGSSTTIDSFVGQEIRANYVDNVPNYYREGEFAYTTGDIGNSCIAGVEGGSTGCNASKKAMTVF